ncbi:MAG: DUF1559 domain-containing protein, partial [Thermoguttaceae bacterium]|nr:DUF1559 domain-containing protein [Thermoguttaceae bacterium]
PGNTFFQNLTGSGKSCEAGGVYHGMMGWAAFVLPFMEQTAVYESINFTVRSYSSYVNHANGYGHDSNNVTCGDAVNKVAGDSCPSYLVCPSTGNEIAPKGTQKDYAVNGGAELPERTGIDGKTPTAANANNARGPYTGLFWANSGCSLASIVDGTSHTFLALELSSVALPGAACQGDGSNPFILVGHWSEGYAIASHHSVRNIEPNCLTYHEDTRTARSMHPGGLNACMADGSVHFVSETANIDTWMATFSRASAGFAKGQGNASAFGGEALF